MSLFKFPDLSKTLNFYVNALRIRSGFEVGFEGFDLDFVLLIFLEHFDVFLCDWIFLHNVGDSVKHSGEFEFEFKHRKKHPHSPVDFENGVNAELFMRFYHIFHSLELIFLNNLEIYFPHILKFVFFHQELLCYPFIQTKQTNYKVYNSTFVIHDKIPHLFDFFLCQWLF